MDKKLQNKRKEQIKAERALFKKELKVLYNENPNIIDSYTDFLRKSDNKVHIFCDMRDGQDIFDKYSYHRLVNNDFYEFIERATYYLRSAVPLVVEVDVPKDFSEVDEQSFKRDFIYHYNMNFEDKKRSIRRNKIIAIIMGVIGILWLALYVLLAKTVQDNVINELISIVAWVFVWEATDRLFFHSTELKVECFNAGQLAVAELLFNRGHDKR